MKVFYISYDLIQDKKETDEEYKARRNELNDCLVDDYQAKRIQHSLWILKSDKYTCNLLFDRLLDLTCFKPNDRLVVINAANYNDYNNMDES